MAGNNNEQFKPRPKPTLGEVKNSGVRNVVGIAPRPRPGENSGKMPPRPNPARPMPPKPPRPAQQPPRPRPMPNEPKPPRPQNTAGSNQGAQNANVSANQNQQNANAQNNANNNSNSQNFNNAYAYQAYSNMLNNMQFMNAIGLVNGIYQNAQMNNRANSFNSNTIDKQTLFDEFLEYMSQKMRNENLANLNQKFSKPIEDDEREEEFVSEAVQGANEAGKSLDQYLEIMCSEDDFVKFGLEPIKVEDMHHSPTIASMIVTVKPFQMGEIVKIGEYTAEDYENLINKNYSVFFANDAEAEAQQNAENSAEVQEIAEVPELEEVAEIEDNQEVEEIADVLSDAEETENALTVEEQENETVEQEELENEEVVQEEVEEDIFASLFDYAKEKQRQQETNENLQEMIEDISKVELEKLREEKIIELAQEEENYNATIANRAKVKSSKNRAILDAFDDESEEIEPVLEIGPNAEEVTNGFETNITLDENGAEQVEVIVPISQSEKYDNIAYKALHYDEILRKENEQKEQELINANLKQDRLNLEINNLKEIVGSLKSELSKQEGEKQELEEKIEITNTRNKEKDLALEENISNVKELSKENEFMKDVVQSLMDEVAELRASLANTKKELSDKEQENKLIEQQLASNSYEILAPQIQESAEEVKEEVENASNEIENESEEIHNEILDDANENEFVDLLTQEQDENLAEESIDEVDFTPFECSEELPIQELNEEVDDGPKVDDYDIENLQTVESAIFDENTYHVDGIIIDEDSLETSGHFVDKIKLASEDIQGVYNEVRNEIMAYKDVKGRCSSACDTFRLNGDIIAKFLLIGKTMKLYLRLDPEDENLPQNIYHQKDESKKKAYKETPFMVKLQSGLSVRKAKKLISYMFEKLDVIKNPKYEEVDYVETLERQVVKNK